MADPGFAKGRVHVADHGERAEKRRFGGRAPSKPPAGSRGRAPGGGVRGRSALEAEIFLYIFMQKKWPKVKDLSENLPRV